MGVQSPPTSTIFGFIRHGQTDWNTVDRFQGSSDTPLNALGRAQAAEAADYLRDPLPFIRWAAARHSPLRRAGETASIIAASIGVADLAPLPSLSERDWGAAEGQTWAELTQRWPTLGVDSEQARNRIPGAEPLDLLKARGRFALETTAVQHPNQTVLMVSHGTLMRSALSPLLGYDIGEVPNAGVLVLKARLEGDRLHTELVARSFDE